MCGAVIYFLAVKTNIDKFDLNIIPGVEISCQFKQIDIHLLVYYVSKKIDFLSSYFNKYRLKRIRRVEMILLKFKKEGINLDLNDLGTTFFVGDIFSIKHEKLETRIYLT